MRSPRALMAMLLLVAFIGCARFPWGGPEDFFSRCMADSGVEVTEVEIEPLGDEFTVSFRPADPNAADPVAAMDRCVEELQRLYFSNSTTTRPE